ncbi:MAG TPA: [protein-PII] uridylyltransferase [Opitutales bacterium]|nr:[protein-PII] uridylyltransferase [Opitutales bacterium]
MPDSAAYAENLARLRRQAEAILRPHVKLTKADRLPLFKEFLAKENERLFQAHRAGGSGREITFQRTQVMDVILEMLTRFANEAYEAANGPLTVQTSLVALGGYGRSELCPYSDVDLMFLFPLGAKPKVLEPIQKAYTDEILYPLWDLGQKIGHSTRTIKEAIEEAKKDMSTKNALLESRLITGSAGLFQVFSQAYNNFCRGENPNEYIKARLLDQASRREKYGNTVFLQEPEIKNGVGGLRDYHNILWMARIRLNAGSLDELVERQFLQGPECDALNAAYDFLLRTRNELHFSSSHPTDLLDLEKQPQVALNLGYTQENVFRRIEIFMRDYYQHAQAIYQLSTILERRLAIVGERETSWKTSIKSFLTIRRETRQKHLDGFIVTGNTLAQENDQIFKTDPARLIRVFRLAQQMGATLDFELTLLIRGSLHLITPELQADQHAVRSFLAILQDLGQVHPTLALMHELGVLARFIPEFNGLTCLVQHEYYHRYTADIHTLNTIKELDGVFSSTDDMVKQFDHELRKTNEPWLAYLMLLLHDIGKGAGIEDHATSGVQISQPLLHRLGIEHKSQEAILFIIKHHLEMARFWQRYDIDDPATAQSFAEVVGDPEILRYLFVVTYCDARGTAVSLWNSYKQLLHHRLFSATLELLEGREVARVRQQERKQMLLKEILSLNQAGIAVEEIEAHFNVLPERYFVHGTAQEIYLHICMINRLLHNIAQAESIGSLVPVIDWQDDRDQSLTVVNVVTWDRAGLFFRLAGAFTVAGVNILSVKAICRTDHIAIDTFLVCDPGGGPVQNPKARELFEQAVKDSLLHNKDLLPQILEQARKHRQLAYLRTQERLNAPLPPSIDIYQELALRRTIIEVQADDRIGLLYQLTKAISDHNFDIAFARISTERGVALDTFHVQSLAPSDADTTTQLFTLRDELNKIVAPEALQATG